MATATASGLRARLALRVIGLLAVMVLNVAQGSRAAASQGDADCNGVVDGADLSAITAAIFNGANHCPEADVNNDGRVSAADYGAEMELLEVPLPTVTPTVADASPSPTRTRGATATRTRTATHSPPPSPTTTHGMTPSAPPASGTPTPLLTATVTAPVVGTATPSAAPTSTATPTANPSQAPTALPPATPTYTPVVLATATPSVTPTAAPSVTPTAAPSVTPTVAPSATQTVTPTVTATATPSATQTVTPTATATATPSVTLTVTPTPSATRTPPSEIGPIVTFFGAADTQGCIACPGQARCECAGPPGPPVYENGIRVFSMPSGYVMLVVEGKAGASGSSPGTALTEPLPGGRPDLQIEASRPLGNGNPAVICPVLAAWEFDGIPAVAPPNFGADGSITDALRDFACRFGSYTLQYPCTLSFSGGFELANPDAGPTVQFCGDRMVLGQAVPPGDTRFTVRLRDGNLNLGPPEQIIVRAPQ